MKKYRLKEEVKKYFSKPIYEDNINELYYWRNTYGLNLEALEEVPSRIELEIDSLGCIYKEEELFTKQEKDLCEKALNGELLDIDSLDDEDFYKYYYETEESMFNNEPNYVGLKAVLKDYLNK